MTIIEMLEGEIDGIRKKFLDKWTFTRNDAIQIMIGIRFENSITHFILPDRDATLSLMEQLNQIINTQQRWDENGKHKETFKHPLDNLQPFIVDEEFHIK